MLNHYDVIITIQAMWFLHTGQPEYVTNVKEPEFSLLFAVSEKLLNISQIINMSEQPALIHICPKLAEDI